MFSLVRFENGGYDIYSSKCVRRIKDVQCTVKVKGGTKYLASLVDVSDKQDSLVLLMNQLTKDDTIDNSTKLVTKIYKSHVNTKNQKHITTTNTRSRKKDTNKNFNAEEPPCSFFVNNLKITSTPICEAATDNVGLCVSEQFSDELLECTGMSAASSSVPSGATEILKVMGESFLLDNSTQSHVSMTCSEEIALEDSPSGDLLEQDVADNSKNKNSVENYEQISTNENMPTYCTDESEDKDDDIADPNYVPEESTNNANGSKDSSENISTREKSSILDDSQSVDIRTLTVTASKDCSKRTTKKHFCLYCHSLQTKFARHLTLKHKTEEDVKKFINIPKGFPERKKIIDAIRKKGDFLHNVKLEYNTGILIPSRQRQEKHKNSAEDYVCCKNCKGFFSKKTVRIHYSKCNDNHKKGTRNVTAAGRRVAGFIHSRANPVLRRIVFPVLRDDEVSRSIKYDKLIILFANKLCDKYTLDHQHDMIRAQLRLLGRFKIAVKTLDSDIDDFASIFKPQRFDSVIKAIRIVAHWDNEIMWFKTPAVAQNLSTLIKKMANKLRTENIKSGDDCGKKNVEDFLLLWEEEIPVLVNKKALEDQVLQSRQKKIALPSKKDIKLLFDYLKKQANISYELLVNKFDIAAWNLLNQYTLILIQIFNRRRAGEIERLKLTDYYNKQALDDNINKDLCFNLSAETMKFAKQYVRLTLRGKLSRTVSVLLSPIVVKFLDILLKYRKHAGIKSDNEYVFAATNTHSLNKKYIRACPLMRKFSFECGALIPSSLRGTTLRKHIATFTAMLDIEETQVDRLANFMGHHKEIHKDIYRIPVPVAEMTDVSRLLVAAMGGDEEEENEQSAGESDSSAENYNDEGDHNNFTTAHSSNSSQNCNNKRRSTSPYGKTKRLRWSTSEKAAVISYFGKLDDLDRLPSLTECQKAIRKFEVLCRRQPQQLKSFIDNQRKLEVRREAYAKRK